MSYLIKNKKELCYVCSLAIPVIVENILQTLLGTVDTYFAGMINDNAIAAISITSLIVNIFIAFFTAISIGSSAVVSRSIGRKDTDKVNSAINQSIILGIGISTIVGLISILFLKPILGLTGAFGEVLEYAKPYYLIVVGPIVLLCLSLILSSCLRSMKDTKTPMIATGIANICNIILNIVFINMGLGIAGLALATTVSRGLNVAILVKKLNKNDNGIKIKLNNFTIDKNIILSIVKIGVPAGVEKLIMRTGQLLYNNMIISIGISAYVAHNIAGNIESYSYIPAMGFGVATATMVGVALGEEDTKKANKLVYLSDIVTTVFVVIIGIVFYVFAPQIANMFTNTEEVQKMVVEVLRLIALFQPFIAITQVFTSALQGAGDTKFPMYITIIGTWIIRVGVGYMLGVVANLGLMGVWIAYVLDIIVRSILLIIRFRNGKWQTVTI